MIQPKVLSLFKYSPIGKNQLSALAQKKIWYSKSAGFNDPFDTSFNVTGEMKALIQEMNNEKINEIFGDDMSDAMVFKSLSLDKLLDSFRLSIKELGILSLTSSNDNLLMWSHYSSEHKGMCLEFERSPGSLLADPEVTKPMNYTNSYTTFGSKSLLDKENMLANKKRILYSKSIHWAYEQEWRSIVEHGDRLYCWPGELKAIYFGCKATESDIHLVRCIVNDAKIKYYKGDQYANKFGVHFKLM